VCKAPIVNGKFERNQQGQVMCAAHRDEGTCVCLDCGIFLTYGKGVEMDVGTMCMPCAKSAVCDDARAVKLLEEVRSALQRFGISTQDKRIICKVADSSKLHRAAAKRQHTHTHQARLLGITRTKMVKHSDGQVQRFLKGILVQEGLSAELAANVIAHEYGHCYLFIHRFPALPPHVEEGVCELFAWLWMQTRPASPSLDRRRQNMRENQDATYGGGFRAALGALDKHFNGRLEDLLSHVSKNRSFPRTS